MKFQLGNKIAKGRPKGSRNETTIKRERAKAVEIIAGVQPLQYLIDGMRLAHEQITTLMPQWKAETDAAKHNLLFEQIMSLYGQGLPYAAQAANYCHAKLRAVSVEFNDPLEAEDSAKEKLSRVLLSLRESLGIKD